MSFHPSSLWRVGTDANNQRNETNMKLPACPGQLARARAARTYPLPSSDRPPPKEAIATPSKLASRVLQIGKERRP